MIVACSTCGRKKSDRVVVCPFCGAGPETSAEAPAPLTDSPPPEAARSQRLLLVLALPILVPHAGWCWLAAKRWGRIPIYGLVIDAVILAAISAWAGLTALAVLLIVALAPALVLAAAREEQLEHGYLLGYSDAVTGRIIAGGALAAIGVAGFVPWDAVAIASRLYFEGQPVSRRALGDNEVRSGTFVTLTGERVDWGSQAWFTEKPEPRLHTHDPGQPRTMSTEQLLANWGQSFGGRVRLEAGSVPLEAVERTGVPLRRTQSREPSRAVPDPETRLWARVPGGERVFGGRVKVVLWVTSAPYGDTGGYAREAFHRRTTHEGTLVQHYLSTPGLGDPASPTIELAILPGPEEPAPRSVLWAPLEGSDYGFWVAFPDGRPADGAAPLFGQYRGYSKAEHAAVLEFVKLRFNPPTLPRDYQLRHLEATTRIAYLARLGLFKGFGYRFGWWALVLGLPGIWLLVEAVRRAGRE